MGVYIQGTTAGGTDTLGSGGGGVAPELSVQDARY